MDDQRTLEQKVADLTKRVEALDHAAKLAADKEKAALEHAAKAKATPAPIKEVEEPKGYTHAGTQRSPKKDA